MHNAIKEKIKGAMIAKDTVALTTYRGLLAAFVNELVAKKRLPTEELTDEECIDVMRRAVKQRKDSIAQFTDGGRADLAESEAAELAVIEALLPALMSDDDVRAAVTAKATELGVTDKSGAGKLMGAVMRDLKGKADGDSVKKAVDSLFS
jgi:uncharacterized protein YqeY